MYSLYWGVKHIYTDNYDKLKMLTVPIISVTLNKYVQRRDWIYPYEDAKIGAARLKI